MELTQKFLKDLQLKLKVGNRKGIYLNATIKGQSKNRFDLHHLSRINSNHPKSFLVDLFSKPNFSFSIDLNEATPIFEQSERKRYANRLNGLVQFVYFGVSDPLISEF